LGAAATPVAEAAVPVAPLALPSALPRSLGAALPLPVRRPVLAAPAAYQDILHL